ncbi:hypothetical protein [Vibrio sp. EJY3]|uniref:hypothetical protein n=1 Tax=Vibrio sp. (strain EJY3) TaxID=1116375 RepID=UPI001305101C|nr:hypothetical protein [Vibrio sp. EJY3]
MYARNIVAGSGSDHVMNGGNVIVQSGNSGTVDGMVTPTVVHLQAGKTCRIY